jgi:broad specificity phosphatase PhoE
MRGLATPSILVWLTALHDSTAYQPMCRVRSQFLALHASHKDEFKDRNHRRDLLQSCGVAASSVFWNFPVEALDQSISDCLLDLPPKPPHVVRLYLCRHAQTENNRRHIVQGSRVDPPLNSNGVLMAERLGAALSGNQQPLTHIYHSPLLRARQTAEIAASQFKNRPQTQLLPDLAEIDFGPAAEGQKEPRPKALEIYRQWSIGRIDERPPGGESCRDVMERCSAALSAMVTPFRDSSKTDGGHIAAVTHSAYLRMMLALAQGIIPLVSVVTTQPQANANINVLDIDITATVRRDAQSAIFGGSVLSQAPKDFSLVIPRTTMLRVNEIRHLEGLPLA